VLKSPINSVDPPFAFATIQELILKTTARHASLVAARVHTKNQQREFSYETLFRRISSFCSRLASEKIVGCKVALIGKNSFEWLVAFLAICASGNTAVLMDADAPDEEWLRCGSSCPAQWTICDRELEGRARSVFGENCIPLCADELEGQDEDLEGTEAFPATVTPETDAAVVFTSSTTGVNKGVLLSHHNLCSDIQASLLLAGVDERDDILAVLPPHHAFQLVTGLLTPYYCGMCIHFGRGLKYLKKDLAECKPSILVLVPVIVRSLEKQIRNTIHREGKDKKVYRAIKLSDCLRRIRIDVRKHLFSEIQAAMGGRLRCIICGGAALEDEVVKQMISMGLPVMTGYGITECSPVVSCNQLRSYKVGTVGRATPYGEVKVIDHELAVRGDIVSRGYYNLPEETANSFRDGWFYTGDLGTIDKKGFITITGRKKNLIILSNGKNVSPEEIEGCIRGIDGVKEVIVRGNKTEEQPDYLVATIWVEDALGQETAELRSLFQQKIDQMNQTLPAYKRIQQFEICESAVHYTRTGKVKREDNVYV
jgi:Long-chain acyl-CoA synthetases (AMP-forming)